MKTCRLIVCESQDHWAIALRRGLAATHVGSNQTEKTPGRRVFEVRSLRQLWHELQLSPKSAVIIEVAADERIQPTAAWLYEARRAFPRMAAFVALAPDLQMARSLFVELGAVQVIRSAALINTTVSVIDEHFRVHAGDVAIDPIWDQLPWREFADPSITTTSE